MIVVLFSLKGGVMLVRQKAPTQIIVEWIKGENPKHKQKNQESGTSWTSGRLTCFSKRI